MQGLEAASGAPGSRGARTPRPHGGWCARGAPVRGARGGRSNAGR
jgi:hypothetical protein